MYASVITAGTSGSDDQSGGAAKVIEIRSGISYRFFKQLSKIFA